MPIRTRVVPTDEVYSTEYNTGVLEHGVLIVYLGGGRRTGVHPSLAGLYPIVADVYDDGTISCLEMWFKRQSWRVDPNLRPPDNVQTGRVLVVADDGDTQPPMLWTNGDASLCYAQAVSQPAVPISHIQVAERCIMDVDATDVLVGVWLLGLPAEFGDYL